jgi:metal-responsive CopG/Arc/MetJ family transcriptional regulator
MPKQVTNASRVARGLRRLTVWLPDWVLEQLDEQCDECGWSRAEVIRDLITRESEAAAQPDEQRKGRKR